MPSKDSREPSVLIVDDEESVRKVARLTLELAEFSVFEAEDGLKAVELLRELKPDLILLDVMMGPMSGFKFADNVRKELKIDVPIIFLTAKDTENDILTGFSLGADDYISKPFSVNELTARVKAVLKRSYIDKVDNKSILQFNGIDLDTVRKRLIINDERVELTKKEYEILRTLLENQGKVFSREDLLMRIWGQDVIVTERTVDVNITRLRTKLGQYGSSLKNKTGYGYFFEF